MAAHRRLRIESVSMSGDEPVPVWVEVNELTPSIFDADPVVFVTFPNQLKLEDGAASTDPPGWAVGQLELMVHAGVDSLDVFRLTGSSINVQRRRLTKAGALNKATRWQSRAVYPGAAPWMPAGVESSIAQAWREFCRDLVLDLFELPLESIVDEVGRTSLEAVAVTTC